MQITPEQFDAAYGKLPFPIREFLAGDELGAITQEVGRDFGLHIDTIGALEREVSNMLLGLINPEQFVGELRSMGIPQENIGSLVKELNAKVFMPLREKMLSHEQAPPPAAEPVIETPVQVTYSAPVPPAPVSAYVPPVYTPQTALPPLVPQRPQPIPTYVPPAPPVAPNPAPTFTPPPARILSADPTTPPISVSSTNPQLRPEPFASVAENVHMPVRTMAQDMQEMQGAAKQSNPLIFGGAPAAPAAWTPPAAASPTIPNMPAAAPQPSAPSVTPNPQSMNRDALHEVMKEYGVDPYREPAA
jgi:hypothetical protein